MILKKLLRPSGMSIIEMMSAAGIMGVLAVAGMHLMKNQSTSQTTIEKNYAIAAALEQIRTVLSRPVNCKASFQNLNPANASVDFIKKIVNGASENVFAKNTDLSGGIRIQRYHLEKSLPGLASNETRLRIDFSRGKASSKELSTKYLTLEYVADGAGNIQDCSASFVSSGAGGAGEIHKYMRGCFWAGGVPVPMCNPAACDTGDIDKGVGCVETARLWGGANGFQSGNCIRTCFTKFSPAKVGYSMKCQWGGSNPAPSCTPALCAAGDTEKGGSNCYMNGLASGGPSGTSWGYCERQCFFDP